MELQKLQELFQLYVGDGQNFVISLVMALLAVLAGVGVQVLLSALFSRWRKALPAGALGNAFQKEQWRGPLRALLPALALLLVLPFLRFGESTLAFVRHALWIWIIGALAWLVNRIVTLVRDLIAGRYRMEDKDNLQARRISTQLGVMDRVLKVLIIFLALAAILMTFDKVRQIGLSILASAGIISIILGFAAQRSLATLFAGIQIALTQPIRIDDVVIVENEWGWIEEITLTYVVVKIWDQRRLVVPITYFIEKPFQNWTRTTAEVLGSVYLYADYTVPVPEIRAKFHQIVENSPLWDKRVAVLQVTNANERTVELRALMSAADSPSAWDLRCQVREKLIEFMQAHHPASLPHVRFEMAEHPRR
ncbi:MAG: mechanosensitive ion channel [Desulfobacterales bacterium]|nr:MAG: mechanosensitive ion channel [Desulfobacterales bacterium]